MASADARKTPYPWEQPAEQVTFATPESIEVTYRVASFGARIAAAICDTLVIALLVTALWATFTVFLLSSGTRLELGLYGLALLFVLTFLLQTFYFVWSEVRGEGRTWGKRQLKLRTVMLDGRGLTLGASLIRNLARIADNIPVFWIFPALTNGRRRVGDLLAGTLVIDESVEEDAVPAPTIAPSYRELAEKRFYFSAEAERRLYKDDLNLLEHLFARLGRFGSPEQKQGLLSSVALRYVERLGAAEQRAQAEADPRRFLEELYLFLRDKFEGQAF
ncbi:MAG: RDD family protein [Planctomycetes bacterium]|nr:RDD family protein [Planctomycetota bacterium]